jgi:coproporphyrinogen III oxidase-like Fe-S oxidoreductase
MMMALRLVLEGISEQEFQQRFGISMHQHFSNQIDYLIRSELLEWVEGEKDILRLTNRGRLLGNKVFLEFI